MLFSFCDGLIGFYRDGIAELVLSESHPSNARWKGVVVSMPLLYTDSVVIKAVTKFYQNLLLVFTNPSMFMLANHRDDSKESRSDVCCLFWICL